MTGFTASNGITILVADDGLTRIVSRGEGYESAGQHFTLPRGGADALREFFRYEEDERLGRWRWPENPDLVVYHWGQPQSAGVVAMSETQACPSRVLFRGDDPENPTPEYRAAHAYFAAHPEPNPWHDAKHNEIWILFVAINEEAYRVDQDAFVPVNNPCRVRIPLTDTRIRAARRIYPEADN